VSLHEKLRQTHQNKKRSENKISDKRVGKQKLSRSAQKKITAVAGQNHPRLKDLSNDARRKTRHPAEAT
jgi:hypothetical protein